MLSDGVRGAVRALVGPPAAGLTYRRFVHLLLGAVVALPYLALVWLFANMTAARGVDPLSLGLLLVAATAAAVAVAFVPGVRALAVTAARALLGATVPDPGPARPEPWAARRRAALWLLLNVVVGGLAALVTFVVVPVTVGLLLAPWREQEPLPAGAAAAWAPVVALVLAAALLHAVSATGAWLAGVAPRLLGPSGTERMAAELERARRAERTLAERNRLARELHDSVGHALTVTTMQAGAAARVLDSDREFVARALDAIAEAGRTALEDLDHVLGLLREGDGDGDGEAGNGSSRAPLPDLDDLGALLDGTRSAGVRVDAEVTGAPGAVPRAVSREAYRIVQEGLTNALRHAGPVPVTLRVAVGADAVALELANPIGDGAGHPKGPAVGGRGIAGMRERVGLLRGELFAGPDAGVWRVSARLPLAP